MNLLYNFGNQGSGRPSFFEMFLEQSMVSSLKPAFEYLMAILAERNARYLPLVEYADEVFYGSVAILERHYLKHYDGSFSENFYGLKRVIVTADGKKGPPLQRKQKLWSIFFLVVVPYCKGKLDKYYANNFASQEERTRMKKTFFFLYPFVVAFYEGLFFIYQLLYMYDCTEYWTPFLHLQGLQVKRQTMHDMVRLSRKVQDIQKHRKNLGSVERVVTAVNDSIHFVLDMSQYLLPGAIFFFKFLEWWYSEPRFQYSDAPIPDPPDPPKLLGLQVPADKTLCPICEKKRTNPAIVGSGFVYCYPCIFKHIEVYKQCPITLAPADVDHIRKIYEDDMDL